ncbi:MAG: NAD-dependent epimerase/dehydratase family protein [bacterium]
MKIVITGAAGFIGGHLTDFLLADGHSIIGIDNLSLGTMGHLEKAQINPSFRFIEADLNETGSYQPQLEEEAKRSPIDAVWHLAANSDISAGVSDPEIDLRDTFLTTYHILKVIRDLHIPRLAFSSTSAVYGDRTSLLEEDSGPMLPISNYGAMKLAAEASISAAVESGLKQAWIFRFPNVIGPRATHGALFDFIKKLRADPSCLDVLGDGTQQKPYLHVFELIDAMKFIVGKASASLNYYNIGPNGDGSTVRYIAETAVRLVSPSAKIHYGSGAKGWVGDVSKFRYSVAKLGQLGWHPRFSSDEAVLRALQELSLENSLS